MNKLYDRIDFENNTTPALNEDNLNAMSKAIDDIDDRVVELGDDVLTVVPQIQAYLEQADDLVQALEELSQNPPYIGANGNWYVFNTSTEQYEDSGVDASITVQIVDVTMLAEGATPYITNTGTNTDPVFHLFIPIGATGNGIVSITKTGTSGKVDTYTITYTNGNTDTFTVTNGQDGQGSGDMTKAVYDSADTVANAGGITAYVGGIISGLAAVATSGDADDVTYDNTSSGLSATNAQDAIDEVEGRVDTAEGNITTNNTAQNNKHAVTTFSVDLTSWTTDTTSQSGNTLYKKSVSLSHVYVDCPTVDIGCASGSVLPTTAEQESYDLLQYVTVDGTTMYLYASDIPTTAFYIKVTGAD